MATSKHIPTLLNADGAPLETWDEMAAHAVSFRGVLGRSEVDSGSNQAQFNSVLDVVSNRLRVGEKERLNAPISLVELREAVDIMKKHKCPGMDGAPVEFSKVMWATVGPLLLQVMNEALAPGNFMRNSLLALLYYCLRRDTRDCYLINARLLS